MSWKLSVVAGSVLVAVAVLCLSSGVSKSSRATVTDGSLRAESGLFGTSVSRTGQSTYEEHWSVEWPAVAAGGVAVAGGLVALGGELALLRRRLAAAPRTA
jgi:hypothetical protein